MRCAGTVCAVAAGVLVLSGCGGGGKDAAPSASPSVAVTTPAALAAVKLSTKWTPKLEALTAAGGTGACQAPGSGACVRALSATLEQVTAFLADVNAAGSRDRYPKAVAQASAMVASATRYSDHECPGDTAAGVKGSPCYEDAWGVTVGVPTLQMAMTTDELTSGG